MAGRHQQLFQWDAQEQTEMNGMIGGFIPVYEKKKRNRNWEKANNNLRVTYRGVPEALIENIKEIAENLKVNTGDVARAFLEFGLNCFGDGEIQLNPKLKAQRMTLFPKEGKGVGWKDKKSWNTGNVKLNQPKRDNRVKPETWRSLVSYRGIPQELHQAVKSLAEQHSIPQGELVTVFFHYALHAYELGRLSLNPSTSQTAQLDAEWGEI